MNDLTNSRRKLIKQVGLGIGLAVSGKLSAAAARPWELLEQASRHK